MLRFHPDFHLYVDPRNSKVSVVSLPMLHQMLILSNHEVNITSNIFFLWVGDWFRQRG